ncbi:MAG: cytochrome c biogenesis protein CcdA [Anaerosomatales bacterium]|nr:cytochrome c biogenesis protein CcdA [Anaerosomatales bacterium]
MGVLRFAGTSYLLGLLTPLTALCVLPLYPAFLARLARQAGRDRNDRGTLGWLGLVVTAGVIAFMGLMGLVFTTLLQESLNRVIEVVSPVAFAVMAVIGVALMSGFTVRHKVRIKEPRNPLVAAFVYGFLFGAIVIPCNPAFIAAFFARVATVGDALGNLVNFLAFGLGIGTPLLALSLVTRAASRWVVNALVRYERQIAFVAGAVMTGVAVYYLVAVFEVFG